MSVSDLLDPRRKGVLATAPPTSSLPIEWPHIRVRMRAFTDIAEADRYATNFMNDRIALVAFGCRNYEGEICVRYLLPQSPEPEQTTAILSPDVLEGLGGWNEVSAIIERY